MAPPDRYEPLPGLPGLPAYAWRRLGRGGRAGLIALLVLVAAAGVALLPEARRQAAERAEATDRRDAREAAERRARSAREARPRTGRGPAARGLESAGALRARRGLVARLEARVLADARRRGRYRAASCSEFPKRLSARSPAEDLARRTARMECIAVVAEVARDERTTGSLIGHPFRARVDFARGRFAWCRIVQRPGELSIGQAVLRIPRACGGGP